MMPMAMRAPDQPDEVAVADQVLVASRRVRGCCDEGSAGSGDAGFGTVLDMSSSVGVRCCPRCDSTSLTLRRRGCPLFGCDPPDGIRPSVATLPEDR
ncbi:hypothetical protein GCM10022399_41360 [Terrabacter ginsenosidimutans]|uniref:Uncharacterized protein n=1 Tax=Terrabacter ginsenosidimutans TaxID=490575 RepID=A0ABP7ENZ5_9MICO